MRRPNFLRPTIVVAAATSPLSPRAQVSLLLVLGGLLILLGLSLWPRSPAPRAGDPPGVELVYNLARAEETDAERDARREREDARIAQRRADEDDRRQDDRDAEDGRPVQKREAAPPRRSKKGDEPGTSKGGNR